MFNWFTFSRASYSTLVTSVSKKSSVDHQSELEKEVVSDCKTKYMGERGGVGYCRKRRLEVFYKNVFLKDFENSQENICARVS